MLQIKKLLFGVLLSVVLTVAFLALAAFVIVKLGVLLGDAANVLTMAVGVLAVFGASFLTARLAREKGLLHGLVLSAIYAFVFAAVALAFFSELAPATLAVRAGVFIAGGALAGVLGVSKKARVRF